MLLLSLLFLLLRLLLLFRVALDSCGVGFVAFGVAVAVGCVASFDSTTAAAAAVAVSLLEKRKKRKENCMSTSIEKKMRGIVSADGQDVAVAFVFVFVVICFIYHHRREPIGFVVIATRTVL